MLEARIKIKSLLEKALSDLQRQGFFSSRDKISFSLEHPKKQENGDYSSNAGIILGNVSGKGGLAAAEALKKKIENPGLFEKIEVAGPGFLNFFLSREFVRGQLREVFKKKEEKNKGKANIEFISANPTGPLHIGNGRSAFAGDVLANVLEKAGFKVVREYFINDAQVSKQIASIKDTVSKAAGPEEKQNLPYYTPYLQEKIARLKKPSRVVSEIQKDNKEFIERKLRIKFDRWVSEEQDLYKKGKVKKMFAKLKERGLVYQKEGAWWLKSSSFGDKKDWVVMRKSGEPTYLLSDIAYHKDKFDRGFQKVLVILGADHQGHASKLRAAARILNYQGKLDILILQLVTLQGREKISKRKGQIITLEELVEAIGLDAARWFYLQKSLDTHMEIDLALAREHTEKNPVFYVQYAHARICSILKKRGLAIPFRRPNLSLLEHESEMQLIKQIIRFPEVLDETARDYQLQRLTSYALELAWAFHRFYRDCRVLEAEKSLSLARLALVQSSKLTLEKTLSLMGISAPEKM